MTGSDDTGNYVLGLCRKSFKDYSNWKLFLKMWGILCLWLALFRFPRLLKFIIFYLMLAASPINCHNCIHFLYIIQLAISLLHSFSLVGTQTNQFFIFHLRKCTGGRKLTVNWWWSWHWMQIFQLFFQLDWIL